MQDTSHDRKDAINNSFFVTLARLIRPGGIKTVMAENLLLKQQLITLTRQRARAPRLTSFDRVLSRYLTFFISKKRFQKIAVTSFPKGVCNYISYLYNI